MLAEAGQGLLGAGLSYLKGDMSGVISAGTQLFKKITTGNAAREKARQTKTSPADVIQFSGCKDNQTSADAVEDVSIPSLSLIPQYPVSAFWFEFCFRANCRLGTSNWSYELGFQRSFNPQTPTKLSRTPRQHP